MSDPALPPSSEAPAATPSVVEEPARGKWPQAVRTFFLWALPAFLVVVLIAFRQVMLPFVLGMLVAYLLAPLVRAVAEVRIGKRRVPRGAAVLILYVGIAAVIAIILVGFVPKVSGDLARIVRETPHFLKRVRVEYLPQADSWIEERLEPRVREEPQPPRRVLVTQKHPGQYEIDLEGLELEIDPVGKGRYVIGPRNDSDEPKSRLSELLGQLTRSTETEMKSALAVGQRFLRGVVRGVAWFVLTFMVAAYLLVDTGRVMGFLRSLVRPSYRGEFDEVLLEIDRGLAGVIRGQLLICLVNGLLTTAGLFIFHVKYALLLGLVAATMSFIPVFGSILSSVPIVAVALASGQDGFSLSTGMFMLLWIVGIHFLEANLLNPMIIGDAAKMHPVIVVFALLVGEETGGILGALVAVPTASIVQALFLWMRRRSA